MKAMSLLAHLNCTKACLLFAVGWGFDAAFCQVQSMSIDANNMHHCTYG